MSEEEVSYVIAFTCHLKNCGKCCLIRFQQIIQHRLHLIGLGAERMREQRLIRRVAIAMHGRFDREQFKRS